MYMHTLTLSAFCIKCLIFIFYDNSTRHFFKTVVCIYVAV